MFSLIPKKKIMMYYKEIALTCARPWVQYTALQRRRRRRGEEKERKRKKEGRKRKKEKKKETASILESDSSVSIQDLLLIIHVMLGEFLSFSEPEPYSKLLSGSSLPV
jgi:hypothetical protein